MTRSLQKKQPNGTLHILVSRSNCGSLTYDGIELGGERLCQEIEEEVERLASAGQDIRRFSVAAYSLGGLVARYAIGLLDSQGFFEHITAVNFTAFASPFLGTRSPVRGWRGYLTNSLGTHLFCASGRQLFLVDNFRETGRPLLEILADPDSIFKRGLSKFKRRTLYGNIANDPSTVYYTSCISSTDPYSKLDTVKLTYQEGYADVIVNIRGPITPIDNSNLSIWAKMVKYTPTLVGRVLFCLFMAIFLPIFGTILFLTAAVQSVQSPRRIFQHENGLAGIRTEGFNVPLLSTSPEKSGVHQAINNLQGVVEDVYQDLSSAQTNEYLEEKPCHDFQSPDQQFSNMKPNHGLFNSSKPWQPTQFPTLALAPRQFFMIRALNDLGWRKYPVHIHKVRRAHAAIVGRIDSPAFAESAVVLRHWLDEEFIL